MRATETNAERRETPPNAPAPARDLTDEEA